MAGAPSRPGGWRDHPSGFAPAVIAWQQAHGRHDLPWQGTRDPYRVWLSEVMLQQTQVATVLRYYPAFLERFPDVAALAAAPLDDVLAAWSGLGYYRRARHLWHGAQVVVSQHGGRFPTTSAALEALPGIGRSTAAAIAAFCFGERAAILDGNVKRVLARALGFGEDLARPAHERALWALAEGLLPPHDGIESYTQGLMDLGASLCAVRTPRCQACPLTERCVARLEGRPERYPVKTRTLQRRRRESHWLWLEHRGRLWLQRRPATGVWAGLWCLPTFEDAALLAALVQDWPGRGEPLATIDHALTHFDWRLHPLRWTLPTRLGRARLAEIESRLREAGGAEVAGRWVDVGEAAGLGLPAPLRRLLVPGSTARG